MNVYEVLFKSSGIVAIVLNYDIILSKFKLHLRYYDHFGIDTLRKGMIFHIAPGMS